MSDSTSAKAKEFLMQIKNLTNDVKRQEEYVERLRCSLDISGIAYDKERVQSSPEHDKFAKILGQIEEEERILEELRTKLVNTRFEILQMIHRMEDKRFRDVLSIVYVDMKLLREAADIMHFSYSYAREFHIDALFEFHRMYLHE